MFLNKTNVLSCTNLLYPLSPETSIYQLILKKRSVSYEQRIENGNSKAGFAMIHRDTYTLL